MIPKALQDRGADFNGTTWVDRTNYFETLPASDENLNSPSSSRPIGWSTATSSRKT